MLQRFENHDADWTKSLDLVKSRNRQVGMQAHDRVLMFFAVEAMLRPVVRAAMGVDRDTGRQLQPREDRLAIEKRVLKINPRPTVLAPRHAGVADLDAASGDLIEEGLEMFAEGFLHC